MSASKPQKFNSFDMLEKFLNTKAALNNEVDENHGNKKKGPRRANGLVSKTKNKAKQRS